MGYYSYRDDDGYFVYAHDGAFPLPVGRQGEGVNSVAIRKFGTGNVTGADETYKSAQEQREALGQGEESSGQQDAELQRADEEPFPQTDQ